MTTKPATTPLLAYLDSYRPTALADDRWSVISADVLALVEVGGTAAHARVAKDLSTLVTMAAHLVERGRPLTLDEMLSDRSLVSFDADMRGKGESEGHRSNRRGALRRLAAVHAGGSARAARQASGDRVHRFASHTTVAEIHELLIVASSSNAPGSAELIRAVEHYRAERAGHRRMQPVPGWTKASKFASDHGVALTVPILKNVIVDELLQLDTPTAVLVSRHALTRNDLELALTRSRELPATPDQAAFDLLRGGPLPNV